MAATLKNRAGILLLSVGCFFTGLCEKIIESALKNPVGFVIFSVSVGVLTLAALVGAGINIIAILRRVMDVFRDISTALLG